MVNLDEINAEIAKLEAQTQTYHTIQTLASLYIVRDHMRDYSQVQTEKKSDFLAMCDGRPVCKVLDVFDELMTTLQVLQPRLYDGVMQMIQE